MTEKILFVDDDENILSGFRRTLRKQFTLETAPSGLQGLETIQTHGPFSVIVSDMRMPEMDGAEFLSQARQLYPDSVRILLTGQSDMQDAIKAINEGNIFRFLTKPCETDILTMTLEAALTQYRLVTAEKELLEKTLNGSIKLLTEVLALANPDAFSRAERIKRIIQTLCEAMQLNETWQFELSAMLSQLGCVTLPKDILQRYTSGQPLTGDEKELLDAVPSVGHDLLVNIPRLETIAAMIARQHDPITSFQQTGDPQTRPVEELGAQMLNIALHFDELTTRQQKTATHAFELLLEQPEIYDASLIGHLKATHKVEKKTVKREVDVFDLTPDMVVAENITTNKGVFLVGEGTEVSSTLTKFLQNYVNRGEINDHIEVLVNC